MSLNSKKKLSTEIYIWKNEKILKWVKNFYNLSML